MFDRAASRASRMSADEENNAQEIVIRPPRSVSHISLRELYAYRSLLGGLAWKRFRAEFEDQYLGFLWAVARPLIMMFVFLTFKRLSSAQVGVEIPYPLYVYSGLVIWFYFIESVVETSSSVKTDIGIIKKVYFPIIISPISAIMGNLLVFSISFMPLGIMMMFFGEYPGWRIIILPVVLLQVAVMILGIGCLFAALTLVSRDWERFLTFALYIGLFISPVIYAPSMIPQSLLAFYFANPMAGTLMAFRSSMFAHSHFPWPEWLYSCGFSVAVLAAGVVAFQWVGRTFSERL